jgi:hypothetical protein
MACAWTAYLVVFIRNPFQYSNEMELDKTGKGSKSQRGSRVWFLSCGKQRVEAPEILTQGIRPCSIGIVGGV